MISFLLWWHINCVNTGMNGKNMKSGESTVYLMTDLNHFTTLNFTTALLKQYNNTCEVKLKKDRLSGLLMPRQKCQMKNDLIRKKTGKIKTIQEESGSLILTIKL